MTTSPALTCCVFAWNEVATLESVVREIHGVVSAMGVPFEVLLIDDGSTDGSRELGDRLAGELEHVRAVPHVDNQGLGAVYRTGFEQARGAFVTFFPGDGQFPATIISQFHPHTARHDLVLGYLPRRTDLMGLALSATERVLYGVLFGKMPRFQGIFMAKTSSLRALQLRSSGRGWAIVMEMILRAQRGRWPTISLPTAYRPRSHGVSKVNNLRSVSNNFKQLVQLRRLINDD